MTFFFLQKNVCSTLNWLSRLSRTICMLALKDIWEDNRLGCSVSADHYSVALFTICSLHFYFTTFITFYGALCRMSFTGRRQTTEASTTPPWYLPQLSLLHHPVSFVLLVHFGIQWGQVNLGFPSCKIPDPSVAG